MKGMGGDERVKLDAQTRRQVSPPKGSHETTSLTRPHSNPGLPGSRSLQLVLLWFSRVSIRSFMGKMNRLKDLNLYREFDGLTNPP
jgi:hypothetical protein